jgi:hypothetical protein
VLLVQLVFFFTNSYVKLGAGVIKKTDRRQKQKNIRVPNELHDRLEQASAKTGYTETQLWLLAIEEYLTKLDQARVAS